MNLNLRPLSSSAARWATVANPAAGAGWSYTQAAGVIAICDAIRFLFTADANVANRTPFINENISGPVNVMERFSANVTAAGIATTYFWDAWVPVQSILVSTFSVNNMPEIMLSPGDIIQASALSIQVGDQFSGIRLRVREFSANAV